MRETHDATARLCALVANDCDQLRRSKQDRFRLERGRGRDRAIYGKNSQQLVAQNQSARQPRVRSQKLVSAISVFKLPSVEPTTVESEKRTNANFLTR